jgi:glycosyltransferase involved in cell wall biosynthesis
MKPLLLHVYPTFAVGGAQSRFCAIANHFGDRWRHAIVAMDGNTECRERLDPTLPVSFPQIDIRKGDTLGNTKRFRAVLQGLEPQTLITSNWGSIEWTLANAISPVVRHVHVEDGFGPEERTTQLPRRVWARRLALRRCITVLPSRTLLAIATDIWRLPAARLRYIPNGIDTDRFAYPPIAHDIPVIGTVAALRSEKNLARLLRAFAQLSATENARLMIVGDGPERPALEALAAQLGITERTQFTGHLADPTAAYREFDIFALSSDTEQMPLSVLEAMAAGLPITATRVGDVPAMLSVANAPYLARLDDTALADSLRDLLRDPGTRLRVGAANRAHVLQNYNQAAMFRQYAALFDQTPAGGKEN